MTLLENEILCESFLAQSSPDACFLVQLFGCSVQACPTLGDGSVEVVEEAPSSLTLQVNTANTFLLAQDLLSCGYDFDVLYPEDFKSKLIQTLKQMKALYT